MVCITQNIVYLLGVISLSEGYLGPSLGLIDTDINGLQTMWTGWNLWKREDF